MNKTVVVVGCIAWAAVAISTATPASARAYSPQGPTSTYAACSADAMSGNSQDCTGYIYNYQQTIKFNQTACNTGACYQTAMAYTDFLYAAGRKTASLTGTCATPYSMYNLGSCSC